MNRHLILSLAILTALGMGPSSSIILQDELSLTSTHQPGPINPHHIDTPWNKGFVFSPKTFEATWRGRGFSNQEIWYVYSVWDRIGSPLVIHQHHQNDANVAAALSFRGFWAKQLSVVRSPREFSLWQKNFSLAFISQSFPNQESYEIFSEIVGFSMHEWEGLGRNDWAKNLTPRTILTQEQIEQALASVYNRSSKHQRGRVVGPYSMPSDEWSGVFVDWVAGEPKLWNEQGDQQDGHQDLFDQKNPEQMLQEVIEKHQLFGLRLPANAIQDQREAVAWSEEIDRYGNALGLRSKLGAGSLGLGGRVFWVYGSSSRKMVSAHTKKMGNTVVIHSRWPTLAHEWFHAYAGLWRAPGQPGPIPETLNSDPIDSSSPAWVYHRLMRKIGRHQLNLSEQRILMEQSRTQLQRFVTRQWGANQWSAWQGEFSDWSKTSSDAFAAVAFSNLPSSYDAAVITASLAWMQNLQKPHVSSWVTRRDLLDEVIRNSLTSQDMGHIAPGYFSKPEEWLAAAFQADFDEFIGKPADQSSASVMHGPAPIEAQAYRRHWSWFFSSMKNFYPAPIALTKDESKDHLSKDNMPKNDVLKDGNN